MWFLYLKIPLKIKLTFITYVMRKTIISLMEDGVKIIKANGLPDMLVKVWSKVKVFKTLAETNNKKINMIAL